MDEYLTVEVDSVEPSGESVWRGYGRDVTSMDTIIWYGDHREMRVIAEALEEEEIVLAAVPHWAVMVRVEE